MKHKTLLNATCVFAILCFGCYAQTAQTPVTTDELQHFRFMLMNLASLDHDPNAVSAYEASLVTAFGLNSQEEATIHAAGQSLKTQLAQLRQSSQAIMAGSNASPAATSQAGASGTLSATASAALSSLSAQREALIVTLANQIVNSVRPETAARLRKAGTIVANAIRTSQGGK